VANGPQLLRLKLNKKKNKFEYNKLKTILTNIIN